ncbi:MAG: cyclic nucleotide-binding domain-containing protein [Myxococcota bacterium]
MHLGALPPAFAGLDVADSQEAASYLQSFAMEAGDLLMEQGEEDYTLAFIVSGAVQYKDGATRIGGATTRDMIGELELFGQLPRTATVEATAPTHLLVLAYEHWLELCERGNPAVFNIERFAYRRLSERLRWLSEGIADRSTGGEPPPPPPSSGLMSALSGLFSGGTPRLSPADVLARSPMFGWADPSLLEDIGRSFQVERFHPRTPLCRQGQVGEKAYLLVEGDVDVMVEVNRHAVERLATIGPGQAIGDSTLAANAPRPLSCVCNGEVVALSLHRNDFGALFASDDAAGSVFRQSMLRNLVLTVLAVQQRFVELERVVDARNEAELRGTPVNAVWRD